MWLAPLNIAPEMRINRNFLCATLATKCPYPFVWGLWSSGKNLGTLPSQITISQVPKCGVILTPIYQKLP